MNRLILPSAFLAIIALLAVTIASRIARHRAINPVMASAPTQQFAHGAAPELESASDSSAIVRWTGTNPGGTALHYGVVHYGTSPMKLTRIVTSPNRRNASNPNMTFRVRIVGLDAHTTYYYRVESIGATGVSDGASSPVRTFHTE